MNKPSRQVMLIEDEEDDVFRFKRAMRQAGIELPLTVAEDGQRAIDYLNGSGDFFDRLKHPLPDLIFLDLNMPKVKGLEVLRWIRAHPVLRIKLVIVLTSSESERDIRDAYDSGANSFLVKPHDLQNLAEMSKTLFNYWLNCNRLPQPSG